MDFYTLFRLKLQGWNMLAFYFWLAEIIDMDCFYVYDRDLNCSFVDLKRNKH